MPTCLTVALARVLAITALALPFAACSQATLIRRTALIPAPTAPTQTGFGLEKGEIELSGVFETSTGGSYTQGEGWFFKSFGVAGDPGLLIPRHQLGLNARVGLTRGFEFGAFVRYAAHTWADPNVQGVLPFPDHDAPDVWSGGISARLVIPVGDDRFKLAILGDLVMAEVAEAVFVCIDTSICNGSNLVDDLVAADIYRFRRIDREFFFLPQLGLHLGFAPIPEVMPWFAVGLTTSVTNTGFDNRIGSLPDDSLESYALGYAAVGIEARLEAAVLNVSLMMPFGADEGVKPAPILAFRVGGRFGTRATAHTAPVD